MDEKIYYVAASPFEAARSVEILPDDHRSKRIHGHSFIATIRAKMPVNWVDFAGDEAAFLKRQLDEAVQELDYRYLNDVIKIPTDENITRWIRSRVPDVPGIDLAGIQSTRHEGANLDDLNRAHIWRRYRFEAAHRLPNVPERHKCGRMHGHGFEVILHVTQSLSNNGDMGIDFDAIDAHWQPLFDQLNLACLNDISGLANPTSEIIASWIFNKIKPNLEELAWVSVYETSTAGCHYDGNHYRIWKESNIEAALTLPNAPAGDPRRGIHGHSYITRLHLTAPLDDVLGWTVDYGDVKELFAATYKQLDHHQLDVDLQIDGADTPTLLRWMRNQMADRLPQLDRIDLFETPGCGAFLEWGELGPALPTNGH